MKKSKPPKETFQELKKRIGSRSIFRFKALKKEEEYELVSNTIKKLKKGTKIILRLKIVEGFETGIPLQGIYLGKKEKDNKQYIKIKIETVEDENIKFYPKKFKPGHTCIIDTCLIKWIAIMKV